MAKKKMSTGKKIAIGAGVAAVVGAILCYFYCPCFKKGAALTEVDAGVGSDAVPPIDFLGPADHKLTLGEDRAAATAAVASAPIALSKQKTEQILQTQRGHYNIPII